MFEQVCGPYQLTQPPMMDRLQAMMNHALPPSLQHSVMARVVIRMLVWYVNMNNNNDY